jgi:hypothetical protein
VNNLVYLSYGRGHHVDELAFSVLDAVQMIGADKDDYRIVVYTDRPTEFETLPVHTEHVSERALADWAGPWHFGHRRKICAIKDALATFGDRVIFCDADTFFTKHPRHAFARVRPGHTLMHIGEYRLHEPCARRLGEFFQHHEVRKLSGERWPITPETAMFNSGVIGMHESDILLLDEVLHLTDEIYPYVSKQTIEQFAFSVCFEQCTVLRQSYDLVHHYWQPERRARFDQELVRVFGDRAIASDQERLRQLGPARPSRIHKDRPFRSPVDKRLTARAYTALWAAANRMGLLGSIRTIAKWLGAHHRATS